MIKPYVHDWRRDAERFGYELADALRVPDVTYSEADIREDVALQAAHMDAEYRAVAADAAVTRYAALTA